MDDINDKKKIENELQNHIDELKNSIERVGNRQDEIKGYIFEITDTINELKSILANLPKEAYDAKSKLHLAVQKNYEIISRFYDNISNFESVRNRYSQDIGRLTKDKITLINIELRKIEEKNDVSSGALFKFMREFREMVSTVNNSPEIANKILTSFENKPEYHILSKVVGL